MQYPAGREASYLTQVVRFLDGSEQRYRDYSAPLHRWQILFDRIDETELNALREFFRIQDGGAEPFSFIDPWDGTVYPSCCLDIDSMTEQLAAELDASTTITIKENRS
jgi:hypothetical protein